MQEPGWKPMTSTHNQTLISLAIKMRLASLDFLSASATRTDKMISEVSDVAMQRHSKTKQTKQKCGVNFDKSAMRPAKDAHGSLGRSNL